MSIRDFLTFYNLMMSFISFITVMSTLVFELDYTFLATWPLLTSIISLFYNYLSIDIEEQRISLV